MTEFDINDFYTNHRIKCKICNNPVRDSAFCISCGEFVVYRVEAGIETRVHAGAEFQFVKHRAFCPLCNAETYVPEISDANVRNIMEAYRLAKKKGENE